MEEEPPSSVQTERWSSSLSSFGWRMSRRGISSTRKTGASLVQKAGTTYQTDESGDSRKLGSSGASSRLAVSSSSSSSVSTSRKGGSNSSRLSSRIGSSAYSGISSRLAASGIAARNAGVIPSTFSRWRDAKAQSEPEGNDRMSCSGSSTCSDNSKKNTKGGFGKRVFSFQNLQKTLRTAEGAPRELRRIYTPVGLGLETRKRKLKLWNEPAHIHYGENGETEAVVGIAQGVGLKDQDRFDVRIEEYYYLAVFDGHGESATAAEYCMDELYTELDAGELVNGLPTNESIIQAYHRLNERACSRPRTGTCALTFMVAKPRENSEDARGKLGAKVAWVGDCRAIMVDSEGAFREVTKDHRIGDHPSEEARIRSAEHSPRPGIEQSQYWKLELQRAKAEQRLSSLRRYSFIEQRKDHQGNAFGTPCIFAHDGGISLQITRSIGDRDAARSVIATPEIKDIELEHSVYARIVLASDGVFDAVSSAAVAKFVRKYKDPQRAALKLVKYAKEKRLYSGKGIDDITAIVFDINPDQRVQTAPR